MASPRLGPEEASTSLKRAAFSADVVDAVVVAVVVVCLIMRRCFPPIYVHIHMPGM